MHVWFTVRNESHYIVHLAHNITAGESSLRYFICILRLLTVLCCFVRYNRAELSTEGMEVVVKSAKVEEIPKE